MVSRELEGISVKLKKQDLDLYFRVMVIKRILFHLKVGRATKKTSSNILLENERKLCHVR
jgi:hypothetical protein